MGYRQNGAAATGHGPRDEKNIKKQVKKDIERRQNPKCEPLPSH
jgi:hypothetical protein